MKHVVSQKTDLINQEKQVCCPGNNNFKHIVVMKGPQGLKNLRNTCYMNAIFFFFFCLTEDTSSVKSDSKQLVKKKVEI